MHKSTQRRSSQTFLFLLITMAVVLAAGCGSTYSSAPSSPAGSGPTVSITAPAAGSTVSGTTTVSATASSSVGIASVQFQVDGSNVGGPITASPYNFSWNTTTVSDGNHALTAVAKDTSNRSTTSTSVSVKVSNTVAPPTVSITAPAANATVSGTMTVTATASSSVGIASVQFQVDGSNVGSAVTASPYNFVLDTTALNNGSHTLTAVAKDTAANSTTSAGVTVTVSNGVSTSMGPLVKSTANSRYFVIQGTNQAVLLAGSHTWEDLTDYGTPNVTPMDFNAYVNFLKAHGDNMTILWRKDFPMLCGWQEGLNWRDDGIMPWSRTGPGTASDGKPKWDLNTFNSTFFTTIFNRAQQLQQNGIYAVIEIFDGADSTFVRGCGDGGPFTGANNINGVDDGYTGGSVGVGAFTMTSNNAVTNAQDAYVKHLIDTLNPLQNIIWEVSEETPGPSYTGIGALQFWIPHTLGLIKTYEAGGTWEGTTYSAKPLQHPVGVGAMDINNVNDNGLYALANADWIAPTINSNFANQWPGAVVSTNNQGKVVFNDSDHSYDATTFLNADGTVKDAQSRNYIWENITSGAAGVWFMDPYLVNLTSTSQVRNTCGGTISNNICTSVDTKWEPFRTALGVVPSVASKLDLVKNTPQPNLSSTGFCLADAVSAGAEYLVYAPNGGAFTVNLSATTHSLNVEWINPVSGAVTLSPSVVGGSSSQSFTPPPGFSQDALLYLVDVAGHN